MQALHPTRSSTRLLATGALALAAATPTLTGDVGYITLEDTLADRPPAASMLFGVDRTTTLRDVVAGIDAAAADSAIEGLVIRLKGAQLSTYQIDEIGAAMERLSAAGKKVHVFTEIYGPSQLRLGAYADEIIMQEGGVVTFPGLYTEEMYLAGTLDWLGIDFDRVMVGKYKGAMETLAENEPTDAWEENISTLLDGMYSSMVEHVAEARGMSVERLEKAMEKLFYAKGDEALRLGVIDAEIDRLTLEDHLASAYGEDFAWRTTLGPLGDDEATDYAQMGFFETFSKMMEMFSGKAMKADPTRDTIAVLHIKGPIMDGESTQGGLFGSETVGSLTIRKALKSIEESDLVKGVIVRIDSPGGSAIASESIWLGLRRVAEKKPVWASIGSMAASGGYYIAVGSDKIYVNPSSIVGSIGVVGGKLVMSGLYDKIDANVVPRSRGPVGTLMATNRAWSEADRERVRGMMEEWYDQFVGRVKTTRSNMDISETAEGRLFVGHQAISRNMADATGGIDAAIDDMAGTLGLTEGAYDVLNYPKPKSFEELLEESFSLAGAPENASALIGALRETMGEQAFDQVRDGLTALMQIRDEPVILASPRVLIIRN